MIRARNVRSVLLLVTLLLLNSILDEKMSRVDERPRVLHVVLNFGKGRTSSTLNLKGLIVH